jgi:hypothetical protein
MPTATDRDFLDMQVSDVRRIAHTGPQALLDERAQEAQRQVPPEASSF